MKEFECGPEPRINGLALGVYLKAFGTYRARGEKLLCKYFGIEHAEFDLQQTYPVQAWLHALKDLQDQFGPEMVVRVGTQIPNVAAIPPDWNFMEAWFEGIQMVYMMNHATQHPEQLGSYHWTQESERSGYWRCDTPYPCALDVGLLRAFVTKFPNKYGTTPTLTHAEGECRHKGGDYCIYQLKW